MLPFLNRLWARAIPGDLEDSKNPALSQADLSSGQGCNRTDSRNGGTEGVGERDGWSLLLIHSKNISWVGTFLAPGNRSSQDRRGPLSSFFIPSWDRGGGEKEDI